MSPSDSSISSVGSAAATTVSHISMTVDAINKCPPKIRERVTQLCNQELNRQLANVPASIRRFGESMAMNSAQLATGGFAAGIAAMPWHCIKSAQDWSQVERALQSAEAPDEALAACFKEIKPMNAFIGALPGETRAAYLNRAETVIHDLRVANVVFDAAVIEPWEQNVAYAFAAKFGISARYVWIASTDKAPSLSVMNENALILGSEPSVRTQPIVPPSAAVTRRIASLKRA